MSAGEVVGWFDGWSLAGALGVAGLAISVVTLYRQRPDVAVDREVIYQGENGKWQPRALKVTVINTSAQDVTLTMLGAHPTDNDEPLRIFPGLIMGQQHSEPFSSGPPLPARVAGNDVQVWTVPISFFTQTPTPPEAPWTAVVELYGRTRWWRRGRSRRVRRLVADPVCLPVGIAGQAPAHPKVSGSVRRRRRQLRRKRATGK